MAETDNSQTNLRVALKYGCLHNSESSLEIIGKSVSMSHS